MKSNSAIIMFLLSLGLFYTFTMSQYEDVKELQAVSNQYQGVLDNISRIEELRDNLQVKYESLPKAQVDRIIKVLPDNVDTVHLALDLDGMASKYGIAIKNIQTKMENDFADSRIVQLTQANFQKMATISFSFVSRYDDFLSFLGDIEKSLRLMDVKSISFQSTDSGLYQYDITADIYWAK